MENTREQVSRDLLVLRLRMVAADMNQLRGGLIEKGLVPSLERRIQTWQTEVVEAAQALEREASR